MDDSLLITRVIFYTSSAHTPGWVRPLLLDGGGRRRLQRLKRGLASGGGLACGRASEMLRRCVLGKEL